MIYDPLRPTTFTLLTLVDIHSIKRWNMCYCSYRYVVSYGYNPFLDRRAISYQLRLTTTTNEETSDPGERGSSLFMDHTRPRGRIIPSRLGANPVTLLSRSCVCVFVLLLPCVFFRRETSLASSRPTCNRVELNIVGKRHALWEGDKNCHYPCERDECIHSGELSWE